MTDPTPLPLFIHPLSRNILFIHVYIARETETETEREREMIGVKAFFLSIYNLFGFQQPHHRAPALSPFFSTFKPTLPIAFALPRQKLRNTKPLSTSSHLSIATSKFEIDPMDSSVRSPDRPRSLHELLGGGIVADVMLWRRRHVTIGILLGTLAAWVVLETSGYTLLSLVSNVLLLLMTILFVWAKAAQILNRPPPPLPQMRISEEVIREAAAFLHPGINTVLSVFHDIALGKDSKLFYGVALYLWLISIIGSLTDFPTMIYTSIVIVLTIPALYEKYEECIDRYMKLAYMEVWMYERIYERVSMTCFNKLMNCIIEILKES